MKLNNLHTKSPLQMQLDTNLALKPLTKQYYNKDTQKTTYQPPKGSAGNITGGHYDSYVEGNPRFKKYFGGSFLRSI